MPVTSQLKPIVDLPVFEWGRFAPANTSGSSAYTRDDRYIYYIFTTAFWRYDTYNDSWQQLASPVLGVGNLTDLTYCKTQGYYGRAIGAGGANNTIQLAGLVGNVLVGQKIRIISGTGAGQERTITAVSAPIIHDRGVVTTATLQERLTDASTGVGLKAWRVNQWRDHQVRLDYSAGTGGQTQCRPILNNSANSLGWYEASYAAFDPWWGRLINPAAINTAGSQTLYQIESQIATVNSNWDINPDATSKFVIMGGGIWAISTVTGSYSWQYYDILADAWYYKSSQDDLLPAALGTDASVTAIQEETVSPLSGTASSGASMTLTDSSKSMTRDQYANFEIRITGGTGRGQTRTIISNSATTFYVARAWDVTPNATSTYAVYSDAGKFWLIGDTRSTMYQYSLDSDQFTMGRQLDYGCARNGSASLAGQDGIAITSITKATAGVTVLNATPTAGGSGYLAGQILTITTGGAGATARILTVSTTGAVLSVSLETCGSGYTTGSGKATTVNVTGGSGCTLDITTIGDIATVTTPINHNFEHGETVTIAGASPTNYNGAKTVLGVGAATTFQFLAPTEAAPTFVSQSTTTLTDASKNWITNEHVGKLVQVTTSASPTNTSYVRRITANTSNTLTFATATAPTNSTSRYVIHDIKAFGTEMSIGARTGGGRAGIATAGSATSLTDSTKNWPVNYWSNTLPTGASNTGRKVRIIAGTGVGQELPITSNSATTLNFTTATTPPDATSVYVIMDSFGAVTSGSTTTIVDTTQNWETNIWAGKRVRITGGSAYGTTGAESTIASNTQTTLTFTVVGTAPDATSTYAILEVPPRGAGNRIDVITNSTDATLSGRYAYIWRGAATSELARYNFNTEQYDLLTYFPLTETLTSGSMFAYDGVDRIYFTKESTGRIMYYDVVKNITVPAGTIPYGMGTAVIGNRMEIFTTVDGLKYLYIARHSSNELWRTLLFN
jgi:hypothetical protein